MTWNGIRWEEKGRTRGGKGLRKGRDGLMMMIIDISRRREVGKKERYDRVKYYGMGLE